METYTQLRLSYHENRPSYLIQLARIREELNGALDKQTPWPLVRKRTIPTGNFVPFVDRGGVAWSARRIPYRR
jgi:hypothetical protein